MELWRFDFGGENTTQEGMALVVAKDLTEALTLMQKEFPNQSVVSKARLADPNGSWYPAPPIGKLSLERGLLLARTWEL